MLKKNRKVKSNPYFDSFPVLANHSVKCGEMILEFMKNFDPKGLEKLKDEIHLIEHDIER